MGDRFTTRNRSREVSMEGIFPDPDLLLYAAVYHPDRDVNRGAYLLVKKIIEDNFSPEEIKEIERELDLEKIQLEALNDNSRRN